MFERVTHLGAPALLMAVLALFTAAPAGASPDDVVRDCADDGYVERGKHSRSDLRRGRDKIPADLDAYSDCRAQIDQALSSPRAGLASNNRGFPGDDSAGGGGAGSGRGPGQSLDAESDSDSDGVVSDAERQSAADHKRQIARAETESLLGERKIDPATAGAFKHAETANGLSLPMLLTLIALALLLAAGGVVALGRRHPQLLAGTLGRVSFPRGLGFLSLRRRRR